MANVDVVIAGTGPAGLLLGAELARRGLEVGCISPDADAPWSANYGIWEDDAAQAGVAGFVHDRCDVPRVYLVDGRRVGVPRGYGSLDGRALRERLIQTPGLRVWKGRVRGAEVGPRTRVATDEGMVDARVLVDATGGSTLSPREGGARRAYQSAWGATFRVEGMDPGELRLMDWSWVDPSGGPPGFLYALPRGDDRIFLEETVLVWHEPLSMDWLAARLERRLAAMGVKAHRVDAHEERCVIVMGGGRPAPGLGWIPWGASGGMVHPATGYSVGHTALLTAAVAEAVHGSIAAGDEAARIAATARDVVWPHARERAWDLYEYGAVALQRMTHGEVSRFFETFFGASLRDWSRFLSATASPADVMRLMWRMFADLDGPMRGRLVAPALKGHAGLLLAGVLPR